MLPRPTCQCWAASWWAEKEARSLWGEWCLRALCVPNSLSCPLVCIFFFFCLFAWAKESNLQTEVENSIFKRLVIRSWPLWYSLYFKMNRFETLIILTKSFSPSHQSASPNLPTWTSGFPFLGVISDFSLFLSHPSSSADLVGSTFSTGQHSDHPSSSSRPSCYRPSCLLLDYCPRVQTDLSPSAFILLLQALLSSTARQGTQHRTQNFMAFPRQPPSHSEEKPKSLARLTGSGGGGGGVVHSSISSLLLVNPFPSSLSDLLDVPWTQPAHPPTGPLPFPFPLSDHPTSTGSCVTVTYFESFFRSHLLHETYSDHPN